MTQDPGVGPAAAAWTDIWLLLDMDPTGEGSPQHAHVSQPPGDASTSAILVAIEASKTTLKGHIHTLTLQCGLIRQELYKIKGHLTTAESRTSEAEDIADNTQHDVANLQRTVKILMAQSEDTENMLSLNNVQVVGLPEGSESAHPTPFLRKS